MRSFDEIFEIAANRHGGPDALKAKLSTPKSPAELAAMPDDRWLSTITKCVFQAGFNWKVIENKWDGFETAFGGFDVGRCAFWTMRNSTPCCRTNASCGTGQRSLRSATMQRFCWNCARKGARGKFWAAGHLPTLSDYWRCWPNAAHVWVGRQRNLPCGLPGATVSCCLRMSLRA